MNLTFGQVVHVEREDDGPLFDLLLDVNNLSTGAIHNATLEQLTSGVLPDTFSIGVIGTIPREAITPIDPFIILNIENIIIGIDKCLESIGGISMEQVKRLKGQIGSNRTL